MRTLIVYASRHGCTEKCALKLSEKLTGEKILVNLNKPVSFNLADFTGIVVGGSIYAGQVQKKVRQFCDKYSTQLQTKPLGLFLCCMEVEKAQAQFDTAFPPELRNHANARGLFGGEFNLDRMNFFEKFLIKKIARIEKSVSTIADEKIAEFARQLYPSASSN